MKLTSQQMGRIVELVFSKWKKNNMVTFKADEKVVLARALKALQDEVQKEVDLEREVTRMIDDLEKANPGQFQRHKMFTMLKQKLAKEKKVIL